MRLSIATAVACLMLGGVVAADPVEAAVKRRTDIPAQALGSALQALAKQRDFQIVCRADLVTNIYSSELSGEFTSGEALGQLLSGTNLTYRYLDDKTVTIVPMTPDTAPAAIPSSSGLSPQSPFSVVSTESPSLWSRFRLAQAESTSQASSASSEEDETAKLEEIVVTAQKREERLTDVPISLTVLGGAQLDNSNSQGLTEELSRVPGVFAAPVPQGGISQIYVRGITGGTYFSGNSSVAYYSDSVPFQFVRHAAGPDLSIYDLERVEVLRGPQGVLYGAAALNGVVRVLTHDVDLNQSDVKTRATVSSVEHGRMGYRSDIAVNVPIVEGKLGLRAVASFNQAPGWIDMPNPAVGGGAGGLGLNDISNQAELDAFVGQGGSTKDVNEGRLNTLRLKIKAQPTEELYLEATGSRARSRFGGGSNGYTVGRTSATLPEPTQNSIDTYSLEVGNDFSAFSVKSMTSYLKYANVGIQDIGPILALADFPSLAYLTKISNRTFAQELLINSTGSGSWQWSLGGFYRDGHDNTQQIIEFNPAPLNYDDTSKQVAVFGQVTKSFFNDRFEVSGGLRYFHDNVEMFENSPFDGDTARALVRGNIRAHALSPRVVATWHPSRDLSPYVSYSEGFRSGRPQEPGTQVNFPDSAPAVDPDTLKNYEMGFKGSVFDNRLNFDLAVYKLDWVNIPLTGQLLGYINNLPIFGVINGGRAEGRGAEMQASTRIMSGLSANASFAYNKAETTGGAVVGTPRYTASGGFNYEFPLGTSKAEFSLGANYQSKQSSNIGSSIAPVYRYGDSILSARSSFAIKTQRGVDFSVFVENLTNEKGLVTPFFLPNHDLDMYLRPRTIGAQIDFHLN